MWILSLQIMTFVYYSFELWKMKLKTSIKEEKWNVSDAVKTEKLIIPISIILYPIVNKELKFMF